MIRLLRCPQLIAVGCRVTDGEIYAAILVSNPRDLPAETVTLIDPSTQASYPCRIPDGCPQFTATLERLHGQ